MSGDKEINGDGGARPAGQALVNGAASVSALTGFDPSRIISEAEYRRRLAIGCLECNADDVRFWDGVIRFLGEFK